MFDFWLFMLACVNAVDLPRFSPWYADVECNEEILGFEYRKDICILLKADQFHNRIFVEHNQTQVLDHFRPDYISSTVSHPVTLLISSNTRLIGTM